MKRAFIGIIAAVLLITLAACNPETGSISSVDNPTGAVTSVAPPSDSFTDGNVTTAPAAADTTQAAGGGLVVSGLVTHADTGAPYPNAWVRFSFLLNAVEEYETHTVTDSSGRYVIQLPQAGSYQVTAGDSCELDAGFRIVGRQSIDDIMITVPGDNTVDFVERPISGVSMPGVC